MRSHRPSSATLGASTLERLHAQGGTFRLTFIGDLRPNSLVEVSAIMRSMQTAAVGAIGFIAPRLSRATKR